MSKQVKDDVRIGVEHKRKLLSISSVTFASPF